MEPDPSVDGVETHDFFRAVIEQAADRIYVTDKIGRVLFANALARDLVGLALGEHPMLRELLLRARIRTIDGKAFGTGHGPVTRALRGEMVRGEYGFGDPETGDDIVVRLSASPVRGGDGEIRGAVVLMHDVTD